jgi:hypothetical protein
MKYELNHENRITTDVLIDAIATQNSFECMIDKPDHLRGYVHHIVNKPFGFILLSDLQVNFCLIKSFSQ